MTKTASLRRLLFPCLSPSAGPTASAGPSAGAPKKRLSTSLRDDIPQNDTPKEPNDKKHGQDNDDDDDTPTALSESASNPFFSLQPAPAAKPRPSKSMVIGTVFGGRRGHVWFCVQHDRLASKPLLLIEFPILTPQLVVEMQSGLVRVALEAGRPAADIGPCPLRSVPVWTVSINGRRQQGHAARRRASDRVRSMLRTMQSTTVGAGLIPAEAEEEEVMYMRANFEHVVGNADSESFHLVNPDQCPSQELSVFLLRSSSRNVGVSR